MRVPPTNHSHRESSLAHPRPPGSKISLVAGSALLALGGGLLLGQDDCSEPPPIPEHLVITSDYGTGQVRIVDTESDQPVFIYDANAEHPECAAIDNYCSICGHEFTTRGGEAFFDIGITQYGPSGGYTSIIERLKVADTPEPQWRIDSLDMTSTPEGSLYCPDVEANRCEISETNGCRLGQTTSVQVIEDDPDAQRIKAVVVGDTKIWGLTLDYAGGNSCAEVDWIIGPEHPGWPTRSAWPNTHSYIADEPGGPYLLNTFYSVKVGPGEPGGQGLISLWRWRGDGWELGWHFPEEGYLQTPHMAELQVEPTSGQKRIYYNHSQGSSSDWGGDDGGSYGVLIPGTPLSAKPTYFYEVVFGADDPTLKTRFTHDIDILEDGTFFLTEEGSHSGIDPRRPGRVATTRPFPEPPLATAGKSGAFTPDHANQNIVYLPYEDLITDDSCGYLSTFEGEQIPWGEAGVYLQEAQQTSAMTCSAGPDI